MFCLYCSMCSVRDRSSFSPKQPFTCESMVISISINSTLIHMHAANACCLNDFFPCCGHSSVILSMTCSIYASPILTDTNYLFSYFALEYEGENECLSRRGIFRICLTFTNTFPGIEWKEALLLQTPSHILGQ